MDETGARDLLEQIARGDAPAPRVNVAAARAAGRRRLRWRRVRLGMSASGAATVVAACAMAVASGGIPFGAASPHAGRQGGGPAVRTSQAVTPVRQFSAMTQFGSFGWLPPGFSASRNLVANFMTTHSESLSAGTSGGKVVVLHLAPAGLCQITGPKTVPVTTGAKGRVHKKRYPHSLSCHGVAQAVLTDATATVNGARAYRAYNSLLVAIPGSLVWEYAGGSMAWLGAEHLPPSRPGASQGPAPVFGNVVSQADLLRIAANIRFRPTAIRFPFKLTGVPANWHMTDDTYDVSAGGLPLGVMPDIGPAADPTALQMLIIPAGGPGHRCYFIPGQSKHVTLDGAKAILRTTSRWQQLCFNDLGGQQVSISLDLNIPGRGTRLPGGPSSVLSAFHRLTLLGANPARWTTHPLG